MKVVIITLNSQYIHSSLAPWYLLSSAKKNCCSQIEVKVIEGTVNEELSSVYKRIVSENADVVAFSCYIWNISFVLELVNLLSGCNAKIILGGPEVSYCAELVLKSNKRVDYVLSGEGEKPFASLLNALYNNEKLTDCMGICYREKNRIVINEPFISNEVPDSPYTDEYFKALGGRIAYIETSRGCPYSCAFCLSGRCGGVRYFPTENAKENIIKLSNSGSKIIKFVDRTFNADKKRAYKLFEFIISNYGKAIKKGVCFHFEIAGDLLTDTDFALLKTAPKGLIQFEIGLQSFNDKTLRAINRKTNVEKLYSNIKRLVALKNIHVHIDLIAGLPYEDYKIFRDSFNTAFSLNADMLQLGFLKLLHGAAMRDNIKDYPCEYSCKPPYEVLSTPWLGNKEILLLKYCENALERFVNSGRFPRTTDYIFNEQKRNPFDTLVELGMFTGCENCALNDYVDKIYGFFSKGSDHNKLRDVIICDIATSVKSNSLPKCLIRKDKRLKAFRSSLENNETTRRKKGVLRSTFLLYGEKCGAYVDYDRKIDGKYVLHKIEFDLN